MNNYLILFVSGLLVSLFVSNSIEMLKGSFITLLVCTISFAVLPTTRAEYKSFKDISEAEEYVFGKAKVVQEAFKITINLDEEETDEFKYLLTTMKNSDSLEEIKDLIGNMEDLVGPII